MIRHPPEILLVVILRPKFIRSPPLGLMMVPVVIISVSPVVPVAAVLVVGPLSGQAVGPVAPGAVAARVSPVPVVVLLVPVLLVLVVPVTAPRRVAAAAATVAELPLPLPVPSIRIAEVSLVGVIIVISWVSMHLWAMGGRQMRLLRVKAVWGVGLRHQGIPA